jgi:tetratricopeptide (TPR) repeat protein
MRRILSFALVTLFLCGTVFSAPDNREKKRIELLDKIEKLRQEKEKIRQQDRETVAKLDAQGSKNRKESILLFERLIGSTQVGDTRRCDAFFQLGTLYYEEEREAYSIKQDVFKRSFELWERRGSSGMPPVEPIADYKKTVDVYNMMLAECPTSNQRDVVLYKLGNIHTVSGDMAAAFESFTRLLKEFPQSDNAPFANLRVGEYYYMMRDNQNALTHYEAVGMSSGSDNYLLSLYRIASCYYNMSQFDKAIEKFFEYIEMADSGKFKKADFRDEAVEFLAISFSEMPDGVERAIKFFEAKGGRSWRDFVLYTIGIKNRDHDNVQEAVKSLTLLLKNSPDFLEAPMALKALIDCQVLEKHYDLANDLREQMIRDYGPKSRWMEKYKGETEKIAQTLEYIKEAAAIIPIYYAKMANIARDSGNTQNAKPLYEKALAGYGNYIEKFPEDKWLVFSFQYFRADILSDTLIARWKEAAEAFDWVSREDTTNYPNRAEQKSKVEDAAKREERDIKKQFTSDIKEQVAIVKVPAEEAAFAAIVCLEKVAMAAIKAKGLTDSTAHLGLDIPDMQKYLRSIKDFRNRYPESKHTAEVVFLEAVLKFNAKDYVASSESFQFLVDKFPGEEKIVKPSLENLAKAYLNLKKYEEAILIYKRLLSGFTASTAEKKQLTESIAATIFQIADAKLKAGDHTGAADYYKQIVVDYPDFSEVEKSLFNAAYAYEQGKLYPAASREFERVFDRYKKFSRRNESLLRAAEALRLNRDFEGAAAIFLKYKDSLPTDKEAIPSVFRAASMFDSAGKVIESAQMYEMVYVCALEQKKTPSLFPGAEEEAPGALYSAGRIYEKADKFENAIAAYQKLEKAYPASSFTPEAVFSIAICYEKLADDKKLADAYMAYVQRYGVDKAKVVHSLMKAAKAYARIGKREDEEKIFKTIISIHSDFGAKFSINPAYAAEALYVLGQRAFERYEKLDLRSTKMGAAGLKDVETGIKNKTDAMKEPLKLFTECIKLETDEWTTRATFTCGEIFWNLMEVVKAQPLTERDPSKIAYTKVKINEMLINNKYFEGAMNYYFINVNKFKNQLGIDNEWTKKSAERYAEGWYKMCFSHIENGEIFSSAPNPFPKGTQEYDEYHAKIRGIVDQLQIKCVPCFEAGIKSAADIYVDNSFVQKMRKALENESPTSTALSIVIGVAPVVDRVAVNAQSAPDREFERLNRQIQSVFADDALSIDAKVSILEGIEQSAKRRIDELQSEIARLKAK